MRPSSGQCDDDYKNDNDDAREYEGPFGEWHEEHLCKPKEFLKQGQQNYQSYQGMFAGNLVSIIIIKIFYLMI